MKAKVNLDTAKLKDFAIQHTEKVVFAIFGLVLLYFAYSGLMHETYDKVPSDLEQNVRMANSHINDSNPPENPEDPPINVRPIEENLEPRKLNAFAVRKIIRPNVRDLGSKRGNPTILPPQDMEISAGIGAVKLKDPPKPADPDAEQIDTRGIVWTTITGIVPLARQVDEYHEAFAAAIETTPNDKEPQYIYHQVQRQGLGPDGKPGPWEDINTRATELKIDEWSGVNNQNAELVDREHVVRQICLPLPPVLGHKFDEDAAHSSLVPDETEEAGQEELEEAEAAPENPMDAPPGIDPGPLGENGKPRKSVKEKEEKALPDLMFRFFDFTAAPGKTYRYRGRVWVTNPNFKIEDRHLAEQETVYEGKSVKTKDLKYLISNWGSPTPAIKVPFFSQLAAGEFIPGGAREDAMNMPISVRERETGYELLDIAELHRGQYANFDDAEPLVIKPAAGLTKGMREEDTPLRTNHFVLDILPADSNGASHAVVMDPEMKLRVVHEAPEMVERIEEVESTETRDSGTTEVESDDPFGDIQLKRRRR